MRILIATDAFPPVCGGSGWSTYELARGLRARGNEIVIVLPKPGAGSDAVPASYDGFAIDVFRSPAPQVPYLRNYFKNERLYRSLGEHLKAVIRRERIEIVHAQHVLTTPPAIAAAHAENVPVVATVRDYWPVCYWSDLILDYNHDTLCPGCSPAMMTRCIRPRAGAAWPLAVPFIGYMTANLARKRESLAAADSVIAVSSTIANDLRERMPELNRTRVEIVPNGVDLDGIERAAAASTSPLDVPYALYVGKLAPNKGTAKLIEVLRRSGLEWPLVVVGDGPSRQALEREAAASGHDVRFTGWVPRDEALRWLSHASLLIFPSHGPESLSRVLIEASALGVPIAAMDTGGTRDIVVHEHTGLVSSSVERLAQDVQRLAADDTLRIKLGEAARSRARDTFSADRIAARIECLYTELIGSRTADQIRSQRGVR